MSMGCAAVSISLDIRFSLTSLPNPSLKNRSWQIGEAPQSLRMPDALHDITMPRLARVMSCSISRRKILRTQRSFSGTIHQNENF